MRTTSFKSLLDDTLRSVGLVPSAASPEDIEALAGLLGDAIRAGWQWGPHWPEWCVVEQLPAVSEWSESVAYAQGLTVWYAPESRFYVALIAASAGQTPPDNPAVWALTAAPATRDMATVFGVYATDPRENARALKVDFTMTSDGLLVPALAAGGTVWVHYRQSPPKYTGAVWDDETAYAAGSLVYHAGECYLALASSTGKTPASYPAYWSLRPVPSTLAEYAVDAAASKWLRSRGQYIEAARLSSDAELSLIRAYDRARGYGRRV